MTATAEVFNLDRTVGIETALLSSAFQPTKSGAAAARWLVSNVDRAAYLRDAHRHIHDAIVATEAAGVEHDEGYGVAVAHRLRSSGKLDQVGGEDYLIHVATHVPSGSNVEHYGRIVLSEWAIRQLQARCANLLEACQSRSGDPAADLAELMAEAYILPRGIRGTMCTTRNSEDIDVDLPEHEAGRVSTGMDWLDKACGGFYRTALNMVCAETGGGKTGILCNSAVAVAREGGRVGYVTLEMRDFKILRRMGAAFSGWQEHPARKGQWRDLFAMEEAIAAYEDGKRKARACKIDFYDPVDPKSGFTDCVEDVAAWAYDLAESKGLDLLCVDYAQLLTSRGKFENTTREKDHVADVLMQIGNRTKCAVVAGSQVTVLPGSKDMGKTADSQRFERNCSMNLYARRKPESDEATLTLKKNRDGDRSSFQTVFDWRHSRYVMPGFDPFGDD